MTASSVKVPSLLSKVRAEKLVGERNNFGPVSSVPPKKWPILHSYGQYTTRAGPFPGVEVEDRYNCLKLAVLKIFHKVKDVF